MKYLILGRNTIGKITLLNLFLDRNYKLLRSYTTRPKQEDDNNNHIFISNIDVVKYKDKVTETTKNGYYYFTTKKQYDNSDIFIINPRGLNNLLNIYPKLDFEIIYIKSNSTNMKLYDVNELDEVKQFEYFERIIQNANNYMGHKVHIIKNINNLDEFVNKLEGNDND